jgi:hypothetical protein
LEEELVSELDPVLEMLDVEDSELVAEEDAEDDDELVFELFIAGVTVRLDVLVKDSEAVPVSLSLGVPDEEPEEESLGVFVDDPVSLREIVAVPLFVRVLVLV